jgi:predicted lysophospholipase L1 biosynthesis ABC-type transport system permease subunit
VFFAGSSDGEIYTYDRVTVVHGRMAEPSRTDQIAMTPSAARQLGVHIGDVIRLGVFTSHTAPARIRVSATVVGIVQFNSQVIEDDIDAAYGFVILTPALIHEIATVAPSALIPTLYGLQLDHGSRDAAEVERKLIAVIPKGDQYEFHVTAPVVTQDEDALRPESIALGAFGLIAALVTLVVAAQAVSRQLRAGDDDRNVLRALGAGPAMAMADAMIGVIGAVLLGSLLAVAIAIALSPLAPLGPVRAVYPSRGVAFDWTVLGIGAAAFAIILIAAALVIAYRRAPQRDTVRRETTRVRRSHAANAAANAGLPAPIVTGVRFAFEPGVGRASVPVRSALSGTVIAVAMVVATLTFAASLQTLVSHPRLYGWNWNYEINPSNEVPPQTRAMLTSDPDVASWSGASEIIVEIDGQSVPTLLIDPGATVAYVPPLTMHIVGSATFPAVGFASFVADHTSMGTGALVSTLIQPARFRKAQLSKDPNLNGPDMVFVRIKSGVNAASARAGLQRIMQATDKSLNADPQTAGGSVSLVGVQRPAQIVNYRSIGGAPVLLAAGLAVGAVFGLSLTLLASVRRRRRELALLKTLGFTRRQLAAVVAWQSTISVFIGVALGVPIGIISGRALWNLFARAINAVPQPTVPVSTIAIVAVGALVLANLVAAIPGFEAARTRTAALLRSE